MSIWPVVQRKEVLMLLLSCYWGKHNRGSDRNYDVDGKRVREWRKEKSELEALYGGAAAAASHAVSKLLPTSYNLQQLLDMY